MPDRNGKLTPEEMFNQMMEEQAKIQNARMSPQPPAMPTDQSSIMPTGRPGEPPILDSNQQKVLNELNSRPAVAGPRPNAVSSTLPKCSDCGMFHPPLRPGEKCGNAPVHMQGAGGMDVDMVINKYLVSLKNITVSQIQLKKIKDINKLLQYLTLEMTKILEGYNEE